MFSDVSHVPIKFQHLYFLNCTKDVLCCIQCPNVDGFNVPRLECILQKYKKYPKYPLNKEEGKIDESRPYISFHVFEKVPFLFILLHQWML